jgi:hypothetical protein
MRAINTLLISFIVSISAWNSISAQELVVHGRFLQDSVKIGDDVVYSLTARYPQVLNILFPDSTQDFFPFEYHQRRYFPTRTESGISYDSVVYYFRTFETDRIQTLSLPVFVIHPGDCTAVNANADSLHLVQLIRQLPDSVSLNDLPLKETLAFEPIPTPFNYIVLSFIVGSLFIIAGAIWVLFGKKIRKHFQIKRLQRNHHRFLEEFNSGLSKLQTSSTPNNAESTAVLWKKYLEDLESKPYTKLTTKEIVNIIRSDEVKKSLRSIDRAIYGNQDVGAQAFEELRHFAEHEFRKKLEEVMNE